MNWLSKKKIWILIILFVTGYFFMLGLKLYKGMSNSLGSNDRLYFEYYDLIAKENRAKIGWAVTHLNKVRNPISTFEYDKNYPVVIYKINLHNDISLIEAVKVRIVNNISESPSIVYRGIFEKNDFEVLVNSGSASLVNNIYLILKGDLLKTIVKNDSVVGFNLLYRRFSLKYERNGTVDIFAETKGLFNRPSKPLNLLFIKRNKTLYFVLMSTNYGIDELDPNLLYEMFFNHSINK